MVGEFFILNHLISCLVLIAFYLVSFHDNFSHYQTHSHKKKRTKKKKKRVASVSVHIGMGGRR